MYKVIALATDRRGFLRFGVLAGLGFIAGCSEEGKETVVQGPPVGNGARRNLEKFAKKGGTPPAKGGAPPAKEGETPAKEAEPPAKKAD